MDIKETMKEELKDKLKAIKHSAEAEAIQYDTVKGWDNTVRAVMQYTEKMDLDLTLDIQKKTIESLKEASEIINDIINSDDKLDYMLGTSDNADEEIDFFEEILNMKYTRLGKLPLETHVENVVRWQIVKPYGEQVIMLKRAVREELSKRENTPEVNEEDIKQAREGLENTPEVTEEEMEEVMNEAGKIIEMESKGISNGEPTAE